jgi:histidyl-tRNA synthetase
MPDQIPAVDRLYRRCRETFDRYGYREIRTPLFEETSLFERSLGEATDVVAKEMFTVVRGETSVSFRPEGTAGVVRAYLEHNLDKIRPFQKLYYVGPMFRFERPQAGRQRQFDQIGIEALGSNSPLLDAEVIEVAHRCLSEAGLQRFHVAVNTIGDAADRERYREVLRAHVRPLLAERCDDCRVRFDRNPLRMLDCKVEGCQPSNRSAPRVRDTLAAGSRARFEEVLEALRTLGVPSELDDGLVRGLDYYTHTVFEIRCPDIGARSTVCGGGRYDGLIGELGGPADAGACGFAMGVTPILLALETQRHESKEPQVDDVDVFVAPVTDAQRLAALHIAQELRAAGLRADTDFEGKTLRALFKAADKRGVKLMVVLGPEEQAAGRVKVKDLRRGEESDHASGELAGALRAVLARERTGDAP